MKKSLPLNKLNKKGISVFSIIIIILVMMAVFVIYDIVSRDKSEEPATPSEKGIIKNIGGLYSGIFSYAGYQKITFTIFINHFIAIIFASILLTLYIFIFNIVRNYLAAQNLGQRPQTQISIRNMLIVCGVIAAIILMIYFIIAFVPFLKLLKPILLPLFTDYGQQFETSYENLIIPILNLFKKEAISQSWFSAFFGWIGLLFKRGFLLSIWLFLPILLIYFLPIIIHLYYDRYRRPIEQERARLGAQDIVMGAEIQRELGRRARRGG